MNFNDALKIADYIIQKSGLDSNTDATKATVKPKKSIVFKNFKDIQEEQFWGMGSDSQAAMDDANDIECQHSLYCN